MGISVMAENTQHDAIGRNHLLVTAQEEMIKFERKENEFRKKDREERAAELRLPLDTIKVHQVRRDVSDDSRPLTVL